MGCGITLRRAAALPLVACLCASAAIAQDTVVVRADNPPEWGHDIRVIEELRIGAVDGPDEYIFGSIRSVTVREDGSIFVYDQQVPIIRHYSPDGEYVRDIGREGAGPGEYRRVDGMYILPDHRLAILDARSSRISVYDSSGTFLESVRLDGRPDGSNPFVVDTAGNFYVRTMDLRGAGLRREGGAGPPRHFVNISGRGVGSDTIPIPSSEPTSAVFIMSTREGSRVPFLDGPVSAMSNRGYLVVGHNRTYALDLRSLNGRVRRITRDVAAERVKREERAQWEAFEAWSNSMLRQRGAPPRDYPSVPATKPYFRGLAVDADGRIWVDRYAEAMKHEVKPREPGDDRPPYEWREPPTFDVIRPDGRFLGTVVLPKDTRIWRAKSTFVRSCGSGFNPAHEADG